MMLAQQQEPLPGSKGEVVSVVQWFNSVSDLSKAEQFWHALMGLEPAAGDPKMRLTWYEVRPFLTEMYLTKAKLRNFELRIPGTEMGVEPVQWSNTNTRVASTRIQDPGAAHLILGTRNIDAVMERINGVGAKLGVKVLTSGGKPIRVAGANGMNRIVWLREPNGFFVELVQPDPLPAPGQDAEFAPAPNYYVAGDAGFTVEDLEKTVRFYRDELGFQVREMTEFVSSKELLAAFGLHGGEYRTAVLRTPATMSEIRLVEFKGLDRKPPLERQITDPGTLVLRMRVRGIVELSEKLKALGTKIVSISRKPYANGTVGNVCENDRGCWFMMQGPDNVFVQLATAVPPNAGRGAGPGRGQ